MTPNELRQAMARAFAEEVGRYYIGSDVNDTYVLDNEGNQIGPLFDYRPDAVAFINERGIAAAMRVAAAQRADCPNAFNPDGNFDGLFASAKTFLTALGELT